MPLGRFFKRIFKHGSAPSSPVIQSPKIEERKAAPQAGDPDDLNASGGYVFVGSPSASYSSGLHSFDAAPTPNSRAAVSPSYAATESAAADRQQSRDTTPLTAPQSQAAVLYDGSPRIAISHSRNTAIEFALETDDDDADFMASLRQLEGRQPRAPRGGIIRKLQVVFVRQNPSEAPAIGPQLLRTLELELGWPPESGPLVIASRLIRTKHTTDSTGVRMRSDPPIEVQRQQQSQSQWRLAQQWLAEHLELISAHTAPSDEGEARVLCFTNASFLENNFHLELNPHEAVHVELFVREDGSLQEGSARRFHYKYMD